MGCGAGMRILTGAGAVAVMGPAVLSFHNKGTLLYHDTIYMLQTAYITDQCTCHSITHMSQYTCDSSVHMSQHTLHVTKQVLYAPDIDTAH